MTIVRHAEAGIQAAIDEMRRAELLYKQDKLRDNSLRQTLIKHMRQDFHQVAPLMDLARKEAERYKQGQTRRAQIGQAEQLLVDNNLRLASGMALHPRVAGDDEIATVDHAFHSMADSIQELVDRIGALIKNARNIIFSLDHRETFLTVSPASEQLLGFSPEELIGSKLVNLTPNLTPESERSDVLNALKIATEGGDEPPFEMRARRKDGTIIDLLCSTQWSAKDKTLFCVGHDLTDRKQAERLRQEVVQRLVTIYERHYPRCAVFWSCWMPEP